MLTATHLIQTQDILNNQIHYIPKISDHEFNRFSSMLHHLTGIKLNERNKVMVQVRLNKRLQSLKINDFSHYFNLLDSVEHHSELQTAINLMTTNETHFFRENRHFEVLKNILKQHYHHDKNKLRVWSSASSTGEEAYSLAMTLQETLPKTKRWEVIGTDLSTSVLKTAKSGIYPDSRLNTISDDYYQKYCHSCNDGFKINNQLMQHVHFKHANLKHQHSLNTIGDFDIIFVRNILIYFDFETKIQVLQNILKHLKPNGFLFVGHAEGFNWRSHFNLEPISASIYRKLES